MFHDLEIAVGCYRNFRMRKIQQPQFYYCFQREGNWFSQESKTFFLN